MKTLLLKILHYIWFRRDNIYSIYKNIKANDNIKLDGKLTFEEFKAYTEIFKDSGLDIETTLLQDKDIVTGGVLQGTILPNTSKRLILDEQGTVECVPTALVRMINYNTGVNISNEQKNIYIADLRKVGILKGKGSSVKEVSNYLRKAVKKDFGVELVYFREPYGSKRYKELLDKGYAHGIGGGISNEYLYDFKQDGKINNTYSYKEIIKYYHLFMNLPEEEAIARGGNIVDNYNIKLGNRNIYINTNIQKFVDHGIFFGYGYFFVAKELVSTTKFEEEKNSKIIGEYRKLAGKSAINDPDKFGKKFGIKDPDEFIAILELIVDRRSKKKN